MGAVLFDSSVYISGLRSSHDAAVSLRQMFPSSPLWLSAVVLQELYAGASQDSRHVIERLERDFGKAKRVLTPNLCDWMQTGKLLARLAAKYGYELIGKGGLTNDGLIAMSAARAGITVITANARNFSRLAEFQPFSWRTSISSR
jgi:predicted nucleic acid-binding protein